MATFMQAISSLYNRFDGDILTMISWKIRCIFISIIECSIVALSVCRLQQPIVICLEPPRTWWFLKPNDLTNTDNQMLSTPKQDLEFNSKKYFASTAKQENMNKYIQRYRPAHLSTWSIAPT
jgi:hypothetical protein